MEADIHSLLDYLSYFLPLCISTLRQFMSSMTHRKLPETETTRDELTVGPVEIIKDWAVQHNNETLTKAGKASSRNKTVNVSNANANDGQKRNWNGEEWLGGLQEYQQWLRFRCPRGEHCQFDHRPGKGGFRVDKKSAWRKPLQELDDKPRLRKTINDYAKNKGLTELTAGQCRRQKQGLPHQDRAFPDEDETKSARWRTDVARRTLDEQHRRLPAVPSQSVPAR